MQQRNKSWDLMRKNLMSDGNVQIVKTGEVIGATQLTEGELIVEAGGRAENTVVTGGWLVESGNRWDRQMHTVR